MSILTQTELSDYEKGQINVLNRVGLSAMQISKQINRPHQTIMNFLKQEKEGGTYENLPWSGRPKALDSRDKRHIVRAVKSNHHLPLGEIHNNIVPQISIRTLQRTLTELKIQKWRAAQSQTLK